MQMKITITKTDVEKAIAEFKKRSGVCRLCPVFQALKRLGVPVTLVTLSNYDTTAISSVPLPIEARAVTEMAADQWSEAIGVTFTI